MDRTIMAKRIGTLLVLCLALLTAPTASSDGSDSHELKFKVERKHFLTLQVPSTCEARQTQEQGEPFTVSITPLTGTDFTILVSAITIEGDDAPLSTPDEIRMLMEYRATGLLPTARETEVKLYRLKGESSVGYFFTLTDKRAELPEGEYRYMSQAIMLVGKLRLSGTLLTDRWDEANQRRFFDLLRTAAWSKK